MTSQVILMVDIDITPIILDDEVIPAHDGGFICLKGY